MYGTVISTGSMIVALVARLLLPVEYCFTVHYGTIFLLVTLVAPVEYFATVQCTVQYSTGSTVPVEYLATVQCTVQYSTGSTIGYRLTFTVRLPYRTRVDCLSFITLLVV